MPMYRVEMSREVSRVVHLRQTTELYVKAPTAEIARDAAYRLAAVDDERLCDADWRDDDCSRVAASDAIEREPRPSYVSLLDARTRDLETLDACVILGIDP